MNTTQLCPLRSVGSCTTPEPMAANQRKSPQARVHHKAIAQGLAAALLALFALHVCPETTTASHSTRRLRSQIVYRFVVVLLVLPAESAHASQVSHDQPMSRTLMIGVIICRWHHAPGMVHNRASIRQIPKRSTAGVVDHSTHAKQLSLASLVWLWRRPRDCSMRRPQLLRVTWLREQHRVWGAHYGVKGRVAEDGSSLRLQHKGVQGPNGAQVPQDVHDGGRAGLQQTRICCSTKLWLCSVSA